MKVEKLNEHAYLIDVESGGLENFIATYVLKGVRAAIIETGPTSSIPNLLSGLKEISIRAEDVEYVAVTHIHLDHGGVAAGFLEIGFLHDQRVFADHDDIAGAEFLSGFHRGVPGGIQKSPLF